MNGRKILPRGRRVPRPLVFLATLASALAACSSRAQHDAHPVGESLAECDAYVALVSRCFHAGTGPDAPLKARLVATREALRPAANDEAGRQAMRERCQAASSQLASACR